MRGRIIVKVDLLLHDGACHVVDWYSSNIACGKLMLDVIMCLGTIQCDTDTIYRWEVKIKAIQMGRGSRRHEV